MKETEHVLLMINGHDPIVFDVPRGALQCKVPHATEAPKFLRGMTFERGAPHPELILARFHPKKVHG